MENSGTTPASEFVRKVISWEGEEKIPGIVLEIGALKWDENKQYPVTRGDQLRLPIGRARNIRREENGAITAEIHLHEDFRSVLDNVSVTIYGNELVQKFVGEGGALRRVSSVTLREVFLISPQQVAW